MQTNVPTHAGLDLHSLGFGRRFRPQTDPNNTPTKLAFRRNERSENNRSIHTTLLPNELNNPHPDTKHNSDMRSIERVDRTTPANGRSDTH